MNLTKHILILTLMLIPDLSFAQTALKGLVLNAENQPVISAVVSLFRPDSTVIAHAVTDETGSFEISTSYEGDAIMSASHISYEPQQSSIKLPDSSPQKIVLSVRVAELDEIVVSGEKPITSLTDEGNIVFNISQLKGNLGADITGALNRLPGVTANQRQGLTLNGQKATLYIDGRKQNLSGAQAVSLLKAMPIENVDNVELASYTGSSYDASGGPVINIVTTKRKDDGWNLSLSGGGTVDRHNNWDGGGSAYVIARAGNVNIYGMLEYNNGVVSYLQRDSTAYENSTYLLESRDSYSRSNKYSGMANVEWMIKPNHSLNFNLYAYKGQENSDMSEISISGMDRSSTVTDGFNDDDLISGTVEYAADFDESLKLKVNYGIIHVGEKNQYAYQINDETGSPLSSINTDMGTRGTQHIIKADLTKRFSRTSLAAGLKMDMGNLHNGVSYAGGIPSWIEPSNEFRADEYIYAAYANVSHRFNTHFSMNAGLRGELTDYSTRDITSESGGSDTYFNLFPSLSLTHSAKNVRQSLYLLSGIRRPDYDYLYPGKRYSTEHSYSVGNPDLKLTTAISVKYVGYYWTYARFAVGYQRDRDLFGTVLQLHDDNVTSYTYMNYADRDYYFAEFTIPFALFKRKLFGNVEVDVNYTKLVNPRNGYEIPYSQSGFWNAQVKGYVQYDITDRLSLNGSFAYYPKRTTAQSIQKPYWWLDFGMDCFLTKKKDWLLSLGIEDVANKLEHNQTYSYSSSVKYRHSKSVTQLVRFRLTWKFGGGKKISAEKKAISNDVGRFRE